MLKIFDDLYLQNSNSFENNSYLLLKNDHCLIIDPSNYDLEISKFVKANNYKVDGIILTHGHYDHLCCSYFLACLFNCKIYIDETEKIVLQKYNCSQLFQQKHIDFLKDENKYIFKNNSIWKIKNFDLKIINTSGHTIGSICIKYENYWFTGDTLFFDSIGRDDLPTGNRLSLMNSIELLTHTIDDNDIVLPGHGPTNKLFKEIKKVNPFIKHFYK